MGTSKRGRITSTRRGTAAKKIAITAAFAMRMIVSEYATATPSLKVNYKPKNKDKVAARILKNIHRKIVFEKDDVSLAYGPPYSKPFFFG